MEGEIGIECYAQATRCSTIVPRTLNKSNSICYCTGRWHRASHALALPHAFDSAARLSESHGCAALLARSDPESVLA